MKTTNRSISPGLIPPRHGLEREEPEFWEEEDIPTPSNSTDNADETSPQQPTPSDAQKG